jgi:glutamate dehydrogenase
VAAAHLISPEPSPSTEEPTAEAPPAEEQASEEPTAGAAAVEQVAAEVPSEAAAAEAAADEAGEAEPGEGPAAEEFWPPCATTNRPAWPDRTVHTPLKRRRARIRRVATRPDEAKAAVLEATVARVCEQRHGPEAGELERFVRRYYEHVVPEDVVERGDLDLAGAALAHWNLMRARQRGEIKVHVYSPNVEEHGWDCPHTVVETVTDDMPFLVDSVSMELTRHGSAIHLLIRPILDVQRDDEGRLLAVESAEGRPESLIHVEIDRQTDPVVLEQLRADLLRVLGDVRAAVEDWPSMRQRAREIGAEFSERPLSDHAEAAEARELLAWMCEGHFTFLGFREYDLSSEGGEDVLRAVPGSGLGILRELGERPVSASFEQLSPKARSLARAKNLLNLTKANSRATVHRPSYLDYVGLKRFDTSGEVSGERRFLGLYTHTAYSASPWEIPVLRRKAQDVLERSGLPKGSHDYKALIDILETYPRDELFQISEDELHEIGLGVLHLGERQRVRLFVRQDMFGRFFSCLLYLPRDRFNTDNRRRIQEILTEAFGGLTVDYTTSVSESVLARLHFVLRVDPAHVVEYDAAELEARVAAATRAWTDDLRDVLFEQLGEERAGQLFERYGEAFPIAYQEEFPARQAVLDINRMEKLDPGGDLAMSLYLPLASASDHLAFKLLRSSNPILLSDVLPLLENMGVKVTDERPFEIRPRDGEPVWIYDFGLRHEEGAELETDKVRETFQDTFARTWRGEAEDDGFNRLVLSARLTAREIAVLRAIAKYLRQAGSTFSQDYMEDTLAAHPGIARLLVDLFRLRLDPVRIEDTAAKARTLAGEVEASIDVVENLDEDRILRSFLRVVRAVLRTNYFQPDGAGRSKAYLSLKLDPELLPDLPEPRPLVEVFVYSPRVEAVHLRGGKVARGGIRWSDRREDFRTEVLGLMKAQTVKNAVIVPVGAKGGFVVKRPPAGDRETLLAEVVECYRTFMRGLLDLTDTLAGGEVVPPPDVVRHDDDDPYLVVAADKGTATFSDIANAISAEYGFWLGDAFASGGSAGYDHKQLGITARGAWESVKRHSRALGTDIQEDDFSAVGIGDMSGDVFGNGMLLSRHLKLVGAFDHRHVFLDPNPDPEASFAERERLFRLPRSSWADYDSALLSPGGGVFPRTAKSIPLSPQVRQALNVEAASLTPNEVIRALLRAPVDLLWNGGIGTYVKAREERHAEAGDKANDAVRVDAEELRCRVVGEGGNLGFTQRARIAYALGGGRIFMDAIDNSAGVDCSDHEVNIKILLDAIVADGDLTEKQRNTLLSEMQDEVASLVLRDNYEQAQAISRSAALAGSMVEVHERYIRALEQSGVLNRELEFLPSEDVLGERKAAGLGLTTPEFAILLSYTKIALSGQLLASDLPEDPYLSTELELYFPTLLRERFGPQLHDHPLRREIIVSRVVNDLVNSAGTTFAFRLADETGAGAADIARAYRAAREVFALRELWCEIEALDAQVASETQLAMLLRSRVLLERSTRWLLRNRRRPLDIASTFSHFAPGTRAIAETLPTLLDRTERELAHAEVEKLVSAGVPSALAERVAHLDVLVPAFDIVEIAGAASLDAASAAQVYCALGARLELHWLRDQIVALPRDTRWDAMARAALRDDVYAEQAALTAEVLRAGVDGDAPGERVESWLSHNKAAAERCLQVIAEMRAAGPPDLARLSVAVREVRNLINAAGAPESVQEPAAVRASGP